MEIIKMEKYEKLKKISQDMAEMMSKGELIQKKFTFDFLSDFLFKLTSRKEKNFETNKKYTILYITQSNYGSRKWTNFIKEYETREGVYLSETECFYIFDKFRIKKENVKYIIE